MHPNVELLQGLFRAFSEGDMAAIEAKLHPEVRAHTPGTNVLAGTAKGALAVIEQLGRSAQLTNGTYAIVVADVLASDDHVAVLYRATGRREGRALDTRILALYAVAGGRIAEVNFLPLDQAAFDTFWA